MDRRDFNKGIMGLAVGFLFHSKREFVAEPVIEVAPKRKFDLANYRVAIWNGSDEVFAAPRARAILSMPGRFTVFPEPITFTGTMRVKGMSLISPENLILNAHSLDDGELHVCNTDTLNPSVTLQFNPCYQAGDLRYLAAYDFMEQERGRLESVKQASDRVFKRESYVRRFREGKDVLRQVGRRPIIFPRELDRFGIGDGMWRLFTTDGNFEGPMAEQQARTLRLIGST